MKAPKILYITQNIHKDNPLRSKVSSKSTVTYGVAKELANILRLLIVHSLHHIRKTQAFVDQVKSVRLDEGECITSYDVKALFTSVPVKPAISIIKCKLKQDTTALQNIHVETSHDHTVGVLPQSYLFHLPV